MVEEEVKKILIMTPYTTTHTHTNTHQEDKRQLKSYFENNSVKRPPHTYSHRFYGPRFLNSNIVLVRTKYTVYTYITTVSDIIERIFLFKSNFKT